MQKKKEIKKGKKTNNFAKPVLTASPKKNFCKAILPVLTAMTQNIVQVELSGEKI